ncbi:alpha/beta hydrolase [Coleofasciculus sp. FACHB-542]|uniref:esterase/lipase family protein n=1 Tax=Coleofasciculus sp. FACHB-542 TaxID=2692787 RepID=UPI001689DC0B|nr:alpha/beta hydrolase [Coleofasciculus sp. FACHB-542]MBD2084027.1 alpha/beta hydrolase [Coleofasciculus sp. FACHB-542]
MSEPTRSPQPIILIRGFGGLDVADEKKDTYQRFNVGTVYPQKQGENYIYEGLILRFMKSNWKYQDTTNVVGYYGKTYAYEPLLPEKLKRSTDKDIVEKFMRLKELGYFSGNKIIIDPGMALHLLETVEQPWQTLWVFRYYDLDERKFNVYGEALVRLIDFIRELTVQKEGFKPKVNIIAHSMGGLIAREAVQRTYPTSKQQKAENYINGA